MGVQGDEEALEAAAAEQLGDEEVLAAGIFGWQDLIYAQVGGVVAGGALGDAVGDVLGPGGDALGAIGAGLGGYAATKAMAEHYGLSGSFLVAVTPTSIQVMNWVKDHVDKMVGTFDRETTEVQIKRMGMSKIINLHDTASGQKLSLHGTTAPYMSKSKPDKMVLHLLAALD